MRCCYREEILKTLSGKTAGNLNARYIFFFIFARLPRGKTTGNIARYPFNIRQGNHRGIAPTEYRGKDGRMPYAPTGCPTYDSRRTPLLVVPFENCRFATETEG